MTELPRLAAVTGSFDVHGRFAMEGVGIISVRLWRASPRVPGTAFVLFPRKPPLIAPVTPVGPSLTTVAR